MPAPVNRIRIFVASPGDVAEERKRLDGVVDHLRTHVAAPYGLDLELVRWETHVRPGVGVDAQDVVNPQIGDYDLFIGIFWNRFGTPTHRAGSGTREEFDQAYARWQADPSSPEIWMYFSDQPYSFTSPQELEQKMKVLAFRKELQEAKGLLVWLYKTPDEFEEKARGHLADFIAKHAPQAATRPGTVYPETPAEPRDASRAAVDEEALRRRYLREVWDACFNLKLTTIDIKVASGGREVAELELDAVFTDLDVLESERGDVMAVAKRRSASKPAAEVKRLPAMAALSRYPKLVLLGDAGSGKSTLVNFVALCLAGDGLGSPEVDLERLGKTWKLQGPVPLRVVLRDYAARGLPANKGLWQFVADELGAIATSDGESLAACIRVIRGALDRPNGALLFLDGLDEVPEAQRCRVRLKEKIEQFCRDFPGCRVLVTSRPYAYQDPDAWLTGFEVRTLADFDPKQIQTFVARWYAHVGRRDRALGPTNAERYAAQLKAAVEQNPRLAELAPRPLLLTLMASLHRWREGGSLPEKRQELYEASAGLLLDLWQRPKQAFDTQGRPASIEYDVWRELGIGAEALRAALNQVAYEAHWRHPSLEGTADIRARDLVGILYERSDKSKTGKDVGAGERRIVEYVTDRAGLLIEREQGAVYTFPHRTFQEYLAACYLADEDFPFLLAERLREDDGRWREASLLAAAKAVSGTRASIWNLVAGFCPRDFGSSSKPGDADWYAALRAAEALIETEGHRNVPDRQCYLLERLRGWLAALVDGGHLPPPERAAGGRALSVLGDPRPGVGLRPDGLPDIAWVEIPETDPQTGRREFIYQKNERRVEPTFWMARYPVAYAQYQAFLDAADGFRNPEWWQGLAADEEHRAAPGEQWFKHWNHPRENVSWYDAIAFCRWLTARARQAPDLLPAELRDAADWRIRLPTEWQWEKAARGHDGRQYPWGEEYRSGYANVNEQYRNIGPHYLQTTSAVGMYPQGASPYDVLDLSGNVWEWCLNEYEKPTRIQEGGAVDRVLRGGSWIGDVELASALVRSGFGDPHHRIDSYGFRVVVVGSVPVR
jgi:formylglycine-generating enzyme required for sulfatase activity